MFLGDFVVRLAQVLVRFGMRLNVHAVVAHVGKLLPRDRLPAPKVPALHAFGVNEHRQRISVFFHDRPGHVILRFPAVIECDHRAAGRDIFFAAFPSQQILHADHRDAMSF